MTILNPCPFCEGENKNHWRRKRSSSGWDMILNLMGRKDILHMNKFKVRCTKANDNRFILGKVYDVTNNGRIWDENGSGGCYNTTESFEAWHKDCCWTDYAFELVAEHRHEIHITCTDSKTTHAVKKVDGKIVARSKAVCCPTDDFNFNIGTQLAFNRLVYGTDYHPSEVALKPEQPKQEPEYYSGKVVCVKAIDVRVTVGKAYTVENGIFTWDNGIESNTKATTIEQFNNWFIAAKFIEFKGE